MVRKEGFALSPDMSTSCNSSFISGCLLAECGDLDSPSLDSPGQPGEAVLSSLAPPGSLPAIPPRSFPRDQCIQFGVDGLIVLPLRPVQHEQHGKHDAERYDAKVHLPHCQPFGPRTEQRRKHGPGNNNPCRRFPIRFTSHRFTSS
jgi:hypothetical protein